ncbi:NADP-dependent oxidoreductase domain - like 10, partial [Theobroma cacao]
MNLFLTLLQASMDWFFISIWMQVESEYLPLYTNYGLGLTTWSPLASGVLTGKYSKGSIPADSRFALDNFKNLANRSLVDDVLKKVNGLKPIADELGVPLAQLAIAWCAANPNVSSVITGATKESQIQENMKALDVVPLLTPAVMEKIEAVVQSKPKRPDSYSIGLGWSDIGVDNDSLPCLCDLDVTSADTLFNLNGVKTFNCYAKLKLSVLRNLLPSNSSPKYSLIWRLSLTTLHNFSKD